MPYKKVIVGIYRISTPNGSSYIGSSVNIYSRWAGHRSNLKHNKHRSQRLQAAYNKHGVNLKYEILLRCDESLLNFYEQLCIDGLGGELNTTKFVNNVWTNGETKEKLINYCKSEIGRANFKRINELSAKSRAVEIHSSIGEVFPRIKDAADKYKTSSSHIWHLARCQTLGRLGVRFKLADDKWTEEKTKYEKFSETRRGYRHTEQTKAKMKKSRLGRPPSSNCIRASVEKKSVPVIGISILDGSEIYFNSLADAGRSFRLNKHQTAASQICKAISGVKNSAYGYRWRKAAA